MIGPYRIRVYQVVAVYRFFSFALGAGFSFVPLAVPSLDVDALTYGLGAAAGLINAARVAVPPLRFNWPAWVEAALVTLESGVALGLIGLTGGLDSPFLIYGAAPILSASMLGDFRVGTGNALFLALGTMLLHMVGGPMGRSLPSLLNQNYLVFGILFGVTLVLAATLPFLTNLNLGRQEQIQSAAAERSRLRLELHDDVAQTLAFLSLKADRINRGAQDGEGLLRTRDIEDVVDGIHRAHAAVRDLIDFSPALSVAPLETALRGVVKEWSVATGIASNLRVSGVARVIPPTAQRHLVQIAREALANAAKHAGASRVTVDLTWDDQNVSIEVRDDGRGFVEDAPRGLGISGMHDRAAAIDASLAITSRPSGGTEVAVVLPYG